MIGDYIVVYGDQYISWSPAATFEAGYTRIAAPDFGALDGTATAIAEAIRAVSDAALVVLIMPRDVGRVPDAPRGHSAIWSRAAIILEWTGDRFVVVKNRYGSMEKEDVPQG